VYCILHEQIPLAVMSLSWHWDYYYCSSMWHCKSWCYLQVIYQCFNYTDACVQR